MLPLDGLRGGGITDWDVSRSGRPRFTLLFSHGNAEDIAVNRPFCEWLSEQLSVDIITFDYTG